METERTVSAVSGIVCLVSKQLMGLIDVVNMKRRKGNSGTISEASKDLQFAESHNSIGHIGTTKVH
eukprot:scaffold137938_cov18-Prasinocladus_malaysianus.AAC.1